MLASGAALALVFVAHRTLRPQPHSANVSRVGPESIVVPCFIVMLMLLAKNAAEKVFVVMASASAHSAMPAQTALAMTNSAALQCVLVTANVLRVLVFVTRLSPAQLVSKLKKNVQATVGVLKQACAHLGAASVVSDVRAKTAAPLCLKSLILLMGAQATGDAATMPAVPTLASVAMAAVSARMAILVVIAVTCLSRSFQ